MQLTEAAHRWLSERGYDPRYGARPLGRLFQREVADRITDLLLTGARLRGVVTVDLAPDATELAALNDPAPASS